MIPNRTRLRIKSVVAFTLVEAMLALVITASVLLGFISVFFTSRQTTEANILDSAATGFVYGLIEQLKMLDYRIDLPDTSTTPATVTLSLNQDTNYTFNVVYTPAPGTPAAPNYTPDDSATAASLSAIDNQLPPLPLSTMSTYSSQNLSINIWIWIDEIPDTSRDVSDVKRVTIIYTYKYYNGRTIRTIRDREVVIRTLYNS